MVIRGITIQEIDQYPKQRLVDQKEAKAEQSYCHDRPGGQAMKVYVTGVKEQVHQQDPGDPRGILQQCVEWRQDEGEGEGAEDVSPITAIEASQ